MKMLKIKAFLFLTILTYTVDTIVQIEFFVVN